MLLVRGMAKIRNYLRVRGEYRKILTRITSRLELPPRARRIQELLRETREVFGTTSACAENTNS